MALQNLRTSVAHKRPIPALLSAGQIAVNTNEASPALFFKDSNGDLVKVGPVHIGTDAPNSSPAATAATALVTGATYQILTVGTSDFTLVGASANTVGTIFTATGTTTGTGTVSGQQGVEKGEIWLDTTGSTYVLKVYDGTAWRSESGTFVNVSGDTMTGALLLDNAASASAPDLSFDGDANTGIYSPSADQVGISTGGTQRLTVDSSGNVMIGTASAATASQLTVRAASPNLSLYATPGNASIINLGDTDDYNIGAIKYDNSNNSLQFDTNNAEQMRIDSSGNVGIGTSSPSAKLDVTGEVQCDSLDVDGVADFTGKVDVNNELHTHRTTTTASNALLALHSDIGGTKTRKATVRADGSAEFAGTGDFGGNVRSGLVTGAHADVSEGSISIYPNQSGNADAPTFSSYDITWGTATAQIRANGSATFAGNVGLGPTSPSQQLDIESSSTTTARVTAHGYICRDNWGSVSSLGNGMVSPASNTLAFATNSSERMRITSSGLVNITGGLQVTENVTPTSGSGIEIFKPSGTSGQISAFDRGSSAWMDLILKGNTQQFHTSGTERMRIDSSGRVLIAKTASNFANAGIELRENGEVFVTRSGGDVITTRRLVSEGTHFSLRNISGTTVGTIVTTSSSTAYNTSSDYRLKENVVELSGAVDRVKQLQPKRFNFIAEPDATVDGFLAHEAQTVVPEAVTGEKDGDEMQGIDQSKLVPLLTAALQEAIGKIETLEQRLSDAGL